MDSRHQAISTSLASPEEVIKYIEEHNQKSDKMIGEGHKIIKKIVQMNREISNELMNQNALLDELDEEVALAKTQVVENDSKLDKVIKKTSSTSLIIGMVVQSVVIILLLII